MTSPGPPVPPQAITAAAVAMHRMTCELPDCTGATGRERERARVALEAAAPHLAATGQQEGDDYEPFVIAEGWRQEQEIRLVPESAVAEAVAAEREHLFVAIRHIIPLSASWRGEALDLIAAVWAGKAQS